MEKFDVMSFYGCENEELQKEYERMFCNMTQEDILNIYNLYQENKSIKDTSYELKLPESDVNAVYLEIKEHEKNLRKKPLHVI
jgi:hypothetical protein